MQVLLRFVNKVTSNKHLRLYFCNDQFLKLIFTIALGCNKIKFSEVTTAEACGEGDDRQLDRLTFVSEKIRRNNFAMIGLINLLNYLVYKSYV